MQAERPPVTAAIAEWFEAYRRGAKPNAKRNTVNGWHHACKMMRFALKREPTGADLTSVGLDTVEKRLYAARYSRSVVVRTIKTLKALWRFISDAGEVTETAPRRGRDQRGRKYLPPGRSKINFSAFEAISGLKATRVEEVEGADRETADRMSVVLPTISGPTGADFNQYRREVEAVRNASRLELVRLCGTLLYGWASLYQEWAGIDGKSRDQWRFALLRFSEYLDGPPTLDDLTAQNTDGVERRMISEGRSKESARLVVAKLRAVWRFAWETGALVDGPPVKGGGWRQQRWSMHRFGRPSRKVS